MGLNAVPDFVCVLWSQAKEDHTQVQLDEARIREQQLQTALDDTKQKLEDALIQLVSVSPDFLKL